MAQQPDTGPTDTDSRTPDSSLEGQAKEASHAAADKAKTVAAKAKKQAQDQLDQQKEQATGALGDVTDALHAAGDRLESDHRDAFAEYAHAAAGQVERLTHAVRDRSVGEILDEAQRFARSEPSLFIGGSFLLGIFGARFLKASESGRGTPHGSSNFSRGTSASGGFSGGARPGYGSEGDRARPFMTHTPGGHIQQPTELERSATPSPAPSTAPSSASSNPTL